MTQRALPSIGSLPVGLQQPGIQNSIWGSYVGGRDQVLEPLFAAPRVSISRKLELKWRSHDQFQALQVWRWAF